MLSRGLISIFFISVPAFSKKYPITIDIFRYLCYNRKRGLYTKHITEREVLFLKKITELGLELTFDTERSAADNFYRQLFGRWPETEYAWSDTDLLESIINRSQYGDSVAQFFGIGTERKEPFSVLGYSDVMNGLRELRQEYTVEIVALYEYGADQTEQAFKRLLTEYLELKLAMSTEDEGKSKLIRYFPDYCREAEAAIPLEALGLPRSAYNKLKIAKIDTVDQLVEKTEKDLLAVPNFGRRMLEDTKNRLMARRLFLASKEEQS